MQKLRGDLAKRVDFDHNTMTEHRDYDGARRMGDLKRLEAALSHFDRAVAQGMLAMKQVASAFEAVGQAFTELTLGRATVDGDDAVAAAAAVAGDGGDDAAVATTRLGDETTQRVRQLARVFADEARRLNEGEPFRAYNAGVHRDVVTRLRPVSEHLAAVQADSHTRSEALARYNRHKAEVERVEKQCAKKGKPFTSSKSHRAAREKRDASWRAYAEKRDKFNATYALLMEVNDHAAAQIIHRYLALNEEYLRQLLASLGRVLPAMAEVYPLNGEYSSLQNSFLVHATDAAATSSLLPSPPTVAAIGGKSAQHERAPSSDADEHKSATRDASDDDDSKESDDKEDDADVPAYTIEHLPDDDDDDVARARGTRDDHGHILTQPTRAQLASGNGAATSPTPLPGAASDA